MSKKVLVGGVVVVAFLNIVSSPGPGFVRLKARFGQVGDQVSQVKDPVSQGQELDNRTSTLFLGRINQFI